MEKEIELLPHNEEALNKLNRCLETEQMASINHATGTGKSFIILKYLSQNRDKRILYLAPTYQIIDQLLNEHEEELGIPKEYFKQLDTQIYRTLLKLDMETLANEYDIIVLDEYHRCGSKKWGEKVQELLNIIREKHPNTKVIGTTATEIRYLDNMKDMNKILFNNVTASELSLSDAIVKGILPVPVYVNVLYEFYEELSKIERRIKRNVIDEEELKLYLKDIKEVSKTLEYILKKSTDIKDLVGENGKYLVFSSTEKKIDDDKRIVRKILKSRFPKEYTITYKNGPKKNNEILRRFRQEDSNNPSVLYSINILNEGVHVKDIDAIFMLRPTISPIIYFQQLGRLLSYSKRKDKVVVLDLVNNIKNNEAMYKLYSDTVNKAKELLQKDPSNKERYEYIIDTLKIVNKTSEVSDLLSELNQKYSYNNLIVSRLKKSVEVLKQKEFNPLIFFAHADIFKYQKYITAELFEEIQKLDIEKPAIFQMSLEEFKNSINNYQNANELLKNRAIVLSSKLEDFYNKNNRLPSFSSEDKDELELASELFKSNYSLTENSHLIIRQGLKNKLSLFDKLSYSKRIDNIDYNKLRSEVIEALKKGVFVNSDVVYALNSSDAPEDKKLAKLVEIYQRKDKRLERLLFQEENYDKLQNKYSLNKLILINNDFARIVKSETTKYEKAENKEKYIEDLFNELKKFIQANNRLPRFETNKEVERELFCKKVIFNNALEEKEYDKELEKLIIQTKPKKENIVEKLIDFVSKNKRFPSIKSDNEEEKRLAIKFDIKSKRLNEEEKVKVETIKEIIQEKKAKVIDDYISFIKEKGRRPYEYGLSEYEIDLSNEYQSYRPLLTDDEKRRIKEACKTINYYKSNNNYYREIANIYPKAKMKALKATEGYELIEPILQDYNGYPLVDEEDIEELYEEEPKRQKVKSIISDYSIILRKGVKKKQ